MKLSSVMLAAACIAMLSLTGHAQDKPKLYSANEVMKGCRAFKTNWEPGAANAFSDAFLRGICLGVVSTLSAAAAGLEQVKEGTSGVCMPAGEVTTDQLVRVVVAYIDARPNRLHEDFRALAMEALRDAWPCR